MAKKQNRPVDPSGGINKDGTQKNQDDINYSPGTPPSKKKQRINECI